jgi:membrane protein
MSWLSGIGSLLRETAEGWIDDYAPSMGAALAYYTMFSLAPLLLIAIAVAGLVFGQDAANGEVLGQLRGLMGETGAQVVQTMLESARLPGESLVATLVGVLLLLVGATTVLAELQSSLDRIWMKTHQLPPKGEGGLAGVWTWLRTRLLSLSMILAIGFLLMVSLLMSAALSAMNRWLGPGAPGWETLASWLNFIISFSLVAFMFALIYKLLPRVAVAWQDVWIGAVVTALLFTVGKSLIGLYIGTSGVASAFGAAGSLAVLLIWVYYSAQVFLLGAEFTWAYAHRYGSMRDSARIARNA